MSALCPPFPGKQTSGPFVFMSRPSSCFRPSRLGCLAPRRRHVLRGRLRRLAQLARIERRILIAAHGFARELDQMMRGKAGAERAVDLAAAYRIAQDPPERPPVIGNDTDVPV